MAQCKIVLDDASSLVRVGMNPHPTDENDTVVAYVLLSAIDREDPDSIAYVRDIYQKKADDDLTKEKSWGALAYITNRMLQEREDGFSFNFVDSCHDSANRASTMALAAPRVQVSGFKVQSDILTEDLYHYFTDEGCKRLKDYLVLKYELNNYHPRSVKEYIAQRNYYDDMLMFNDPTRGGWDRTATIMANMPLKKGDKVVDMGCGFGYNTLRLLDLVGETGFVYATDTEQPYAEYVGNIMALGGYRNVKAVHTQSNDLGVDDQVDCILMSSLYHIIYTWSREDERKAMLTSIKEHLKPGGFIVVVDNLNRHGEELNNCHVDPRLVQAQLGYWGFRTIDMKELSEQRYMLTLQRDDSYKPTTASLLTPSSHISQSSTHKSFTIESQKSVVHIGSLDSYDITDRGIDAANYVYDFMGGGDRSLAEIAIKKYDEIIPAENFGGEYSALQWLCEAKIASEAERREMLKDPLSNSFYHYLTDDSCRVLRYYLLHKYKLGNDSIRMLSDSLLEKTGEVGRTHRSYLEDYILALNPKRPTWEHTPVIISHLGNLQGKTIADIGSGSGFFTYKFSNMVGNDGKVYALELKDEHISRLKTFLQETDIRNVEVLKGKEDILELPEQVDMMFMCSLYHIMYGVISDSDRDTYLKSLVRQLKPGGELIIVDNGPVDDDTLPYHGPYISRELIEYQLSFYGFELTDYVQVIPQRYMLKFKLRQ